MALSAQCEVHPGETLYEKEGQYGSFFSHKTEDPAYASQKGYCNGKPPKGMANFGGEGYKAFKQAGEAIAHRPEPTYTPVNQEERSRRIERQHSQEMSLRYWAIQVSLATVDVSIEDIDKMTDHFEQDLNDS